MGSVSVCRQQPGCFGAAGLLIAKLRHDQAAQLLTLPGRSRQATFQVKSCLLSRRPKIHSNLSPLRPSNSSHFTAATDRERDKFALMANGSVTSSGSVSFVMVRVTGPGKGRVMRPVPAKWRQYPGSPFSRTCDAGGHPVALSCLHNVATYSPTPPANHTLSTRSANTYPPPRPPIT